MYFGKGRIQSFIYLTRFSHVLRIIIKYIALRHGSWQVCPVADACVILDFMMFCDACYTDCENSEDRLPWRCYARVGNRVRRYLPSIEQQTLSQV